MKTTSEAITTMENPGKFAIESKAQGIAAIVVSNPDAIYMYMPSRHEYIGIDGKPYSLAALKGKTVMLDFWASWCGPCRESAPSMEKIYSDYKNRRLVVLGVNVGEERDVIDAFVKKHSFAYPIVMIGESTILTDYKVNAYPTFILIEEGKVIAEQIGFPGEPSLRKMLDKIQARRKAIDDRRGALSPNAINERQMEAVAMAGSRSRRASLGLE